MIEIPFKAGSPPRAIVVRIHEPFPSAPGAGPPGKEWPWSIVVDVDGRPSTTYGVDPLDAVENASNHAAIVLHAVYGDDLDPPVEPRSRP
jgi:hypothetical protein